MPQEPLQRIAVTARTQKQIKILAALKGREIYVLMNQMVDQVWQQALTAGLVNERMLEKIDLGLTAEGEAEGGVSYVQKIQE